MQFLRKKKVEMSLMVHQYLFLVYLEAARLPYPARKEARSSVGKKSDHGYNPDEATISSLVFIKS